MPLTLIDRFLTPDETVFLVVFEVVALAVALVILVRTAARVFPRFGASRNPATWGPAWATIRLASERQNRARPFPHVWQDRWTAAYVTSARQWASLHTSTWSVDKPAVEHAACDAYRAFGEPPPFVRVWVRSPREAAAAEPILCTFLAELHEHHRPVTVAWARAVEQNRPMSPDATWEAVVAIVAEQLPRRVPWAWRARSAFQQRRPSFPHMWPGFAFIDHWAALRDRELAEVHRSVEAAVGPGPDQIASAIGYQLAQDGLAPPLPRRNVPHEVGCLGVNARLLGSTLERRVVPLASIAAGCGGWLPLVGAAVFIDRPIAMSSNEHGSPHRTDGPAVCYADGWRIWAIDGIAVPRAAVEYPDDLGVAVIQAEPDRRRRVLLVRQMGERTYRARVGATAEAIGAEPDVALQRELLAAFGRERYMREVGRVVHADTDGLDHPRRLWRAERRADEPLAFVEVMNSTPEPDGSTRTYWLRVPPDITTCQAAVAWTFGLRDIDYVLDRES